MPETQTDRQDRAVQEFAEVLRQLADRVEEDGLVRRVDIDNDIETRPWSLPENGEVVYRAGTIVVDGALPSGDLYLEYPYEEIHQTENEPSLDDSIDFEIITPVPESTL